MDATRNNLKAKPARRPNFLGIFIIVLIIIYAIVAASLPMKTLTPEENTIKPQDLNLPVIVWPNYGESAFGAQGYGVLASNGDEVGKPIASITKTILALSVLKEKPLKLGEKGPIYKITENDINLYKSNLAQNGSVVPVALNEELTEYQMLQALLIPSGDNIADTLAIWVFGSIDNYLKYANEYVNGLGLKQTHVADASGLSPQSVSSASDLVALGEYIMNEPVLAEIVGQSEVTLPVLNTAKNYNTLIGTDGINGIKTGNTDEAGGCLLFSAKKNINGKDVTVIGAILGAANRARVLIDTKNFLEGNSGAFGLASVLSKETSLGVYKTPWGKKINIIPKNELSLLTAKGNNISIQVSLNNIDKPADKDTEVGTITITSGGKTFTVPAVLSESITAPPLYWKLLHPFK